MRDQAYLARAEGDRIKTQEGWERARKFWEAQLARKPDDWQPADAYTVADGAFREGWEASGMSDYDEYEKHRP